MKLKIQPHSNQGKDLIITIYNPTDKDVFFKVGHVIVSNEKNESIGVINVERQTGISLLKANDNLKVAVQIDEPLKNGFSLQYAIHEKEKSEKHDEKYCEYVHFYKLYDCWQKAKNNNE